MKNAYFTALQQKNGILIGAHRGTHGGNVVQNTCLAYELSLKHGAQILECDTVMTTDGQFYAFHNGYEKEILGLNTDIRKMSSIEVDKIYCLNELGQSSLQKTERVENILRQFKDRCIINIDRSWFYWEETLHFLKQFDMDEQILLKSPPDKELLSVLEKSNSRIAYMPILKKREELETVLSYNINFSAAELCFKTPENPLVADEVMKLLSDRGIFIWANAINLGGDHILSGGFDDDISIRGEPEKGWGKLINMGFNMIQTDWPYLLSQYIKNNGTD